MPATDTVVIGAGQAGLATSRCLTDEGRDHVVLERGRAAQRWRSGSWDSLRLLTPNWMTRLPGWSYQGADPDGFMAVSELVAFLEGYARSFSAPVHDETTVLSVDRSADGYRVVTDQGTWQAANVVIATGECGTPYVPPLAFDLPADVHQVTSDRYRNPDDLPDGGVLVVGASSTGTQLAEELARSGRTVTLAVGDHSRLPRSYRGMDAFWWLQATGSLDKTIDDVPDADAARRAPSLQLVGRPDHRRLDLGTLQADGVRLAGRLRAVDGSRLSFADDLAASTGAAERRLDRVLDAIDAYVTAARLERELDPPDRPEPIRATSGPDTVDLRAEGISTVLWATGFRASYPWLRVPVIDARGAIAQRRGVTGSPGLYVVGLRFLHHRNSNFIDGVGRDARALVDHLVGRRAHEEAAA